MCSLCMLVVGPPIVLQALYDQTQPPSYLYEEGIFDPHWCPRDVRWNDKAPYAVVNIAKMPCRVEHTIVSFSKSYAFNKDGASTIFDIGGVEYVTKEPNIDVENP